MSNNYMIHLIDDPAASDSPDGPHEVEIDDPTSGAWRGEFLSAAPDYLNPGGPRFARIAEGPLEGRVAPVEVSVDQVDGRMVGELLGTAPFVSR